MTLHFRTKAGHYHPVTLSVVGVVSTITTDVLRTTRKTVKLLAETSSGRGDINHAFHEAEMKATETAQEIFARMDQRFW